ncbi:uncharacterized protein LOC114916986 [Cajanus cajan]|uniref:uncharacterized protein LOC114916986 n=1 Tax=Cajanus cajan TaxID=3821 RepID=UPI0010FB073E|nr:uncharacterized protein LOC114916986 [Cajanus cajan]
MRRLFISQSLVVETLYYEVRGSKRHLLNLKIREIENKNVRPPYLYKNLPIVEQVSIESCSPDERVFFSHASPMPCIYMLFKDLEIMEKSKGRQLKAKFNAEEMETLEANLAPSHRRKKPKIDIEKEKSDVKQKIDVGQKIGVQTANIEHEGEANIEIIDITDPEVGQKDTEKKYVNNSNLESASS